MDLLSDNDRLSHFRQIIQNSILSIQKYKQYDIISSNDVNIGITQLETLYKKTFQNMSFNVLREDMLKISLPFI